MQPEENTNDLNFRAMAKDREDVAEALSQDEIWLTIVSKFVILDLPAHMKTEMMLQACGYDYELVKKYVAMGVEKQLYEKDIADEVLQMIDHAK